MDNKKIRAMIVLEILGRPAEYIVEALDKLVEQLGNEKGIKVINKEIHKPKIVEQKKDEKENKEQKNENVMKVEAELYTTFASVEVEVDEIITMMGIIFRYMPSHVEIISPENLMLSNSDFGTMLNEMTTKLHRYDEITKTVMGEKEILENQLKIIFERIKAAQEERNRMNIPSMKVTTNAKESSGSSEKVFGEKENSESGKEIKEKNGKRKK